MFSSSALPASSVASPPMPAPRLAQVPPPYGVTIGVAGDAPARPPSPRRPSSATIWASMASVPCPCSVTLASTVTAPARLEAEGGAVLRRDARAADAVECGARAGQLDEDAEPDAAIDAACSRSASCSAPQRRGSPTRSSSASSALLVRELLEERARSARCTGTCRRSGGCGAAPRPGSSRSSRATRSTMASITARRSGWPTARYWRHRRLVLEAPRGRAPRSRGSGRGRASGRSDLAALDHARARIHRDRGRPAARSSRRDREDGAVALRPRPRAVDACSREWMSVLERLEAVGHELHRPAQHDRERAGRHLVGVHVDLDAEGAADVLAITRTRCSGNAEWREQIRASCAAPGSSDTRSASRRPRS